MFNISLNTALNTSLNTALNTALNIAFDKNISFDKIDKINKINKKYLYNDKLNGKNIYNSGISDELTQYIKECNENSVERIIALDKIKKNREIFDKCFKKTYVRKTIQ